ncbi:unnamed protein product [Somion occarium]|uniref:Uncharacterized protein n=1 Tax=Somion occarium TaxID=3059160 RepID=A0ABP1CSR6_9APHY
MSYTHPPVTDSEIIQYLYILRYFGHSLQDIYPLYPHPRVPLEKGPIAATLDALAAACTLQADQETALAIVQEPGQALLYVSQTGTVDRRLASHLKRLWALLYQYRTVQFTDSPNADDERRCLRRRICRFLYRRCFRPYRFSERERVSFRTFSEVMRNAQDVYLAGDLTYILDVLESHSRYDSHWDDDTLYQFAVSNANVARDLAKCPLYKWETAFKSLINRSDVYPEIRNFSLRRYAEKALLFDTHVKRLLHVAEPKSPTVRLGVFLTLPLHLITISSHPSTSISVDVSIDTLLPLLNHELDPSATPLTADLLRHRRDESCPEMSGVDTVDLSGVCPHPELTLLAYLYNHCKSAFPYIGLSRPTCYACFRWFDAYNARVNPSGDIPYRLDGPDPEFRLPWVLPPRLQFGCGVFGLGESEGLRGSGSGEVSGELNGVLWEMFARTVKQDVRDLWMRAVSFQRVSHKNAELLERLNRIAGKHQLDDEEEAKEALVSVMEALRTEEIAIQVSS